MSWQGKFRSQVLMCLLEFSHALPTCIIRDTVMILLRELDRAGVLQRKTRRLNRRVYFSRVHIVLS